jgi:diguanylate cyclase (GGDEF)-like protein
VPSEAGGDAVRRSASARAYDASPLEGAGLDLRLAGYTAAALSLAGAILLGAVALPISHRPSALALAIIGSLTVAFSGLLGLLTRQDRLTLRRLFAANFVAIGLIAALVAVTGREHSIYAELYLFAVVPAAAFQPRRRLIAVLVFASLAFLAPVVYGHAGQSFLAIAVVSMPPVILAAVVIAIAAHIHRGQRYQLMGRAAEARRLAENDALTGLGNYRMFWRNLDAEVARSRRHGDPFSLVILDLDGFKAINDEHGHQAGDRALRHVAGALRGALRGEDVCCRQGGDEFAVIAVRAEEEEAAELAERLTSAVSEITVPGAEDRRLGASAGWATFGRPATTADELILGADEALRAAKRRPRTDGVPERTSPLADAARETTGSRGGQEHSASSEGSSRRLVVLAGFARALAGARDERAIAETTVAHLAGAVDAATTMVLRRDPAGVPRLLAAAGLPARNGATTGPQPSLLARTAMEETRTVSGTGDDAGRLAVPVMVRGDAWGALLIETRRPGDQDSETRGMAEAIAAQMSRALACLLVLDRLPDADFGELYRLAAAVEGMEGESWRVADLAWQVGRRLDFSPEGLRALYLAALFHDVGTVGVPAELMGKRGELSQAERAVLHEHPVIGERMMRPLPLLRDASSIILHEHERFDGDGYPDGLAGEDIPLASRVLLACDAWVAMRSARPWRDARPLEGAFEELRQAAGTQLDPAVVEVLERVLDSEEPVRPARR